MLTLWWGFYGRFRLIIIHNINISILNRCIFFDFRQFYLQNSPMPQVDYILQHFFMLYIELPPILGKNLKTTNLNPCFFLNLYGLTVTSCKRSMYLWLGLSENRYRYSGVYTLIIYWERSIAEPFSLIKIIYKIRSRKKGNT